jgi:hypothetical protein
MTLPLTAPTCGGMLGLARRIAGPVDQPETDFAGAPGLRSKDAQGDVPNAPKNSVSPDPPDGDLGVLPRPRRARSDVGPG